MKRALPGWVTIAVCGWFVWLSRSTSAGLLVDSDTAVLLRAIRERGNPLSWFTGDWPLGNHFYRPISTQFFELDNAVWGNQAAGYGATNALLAVAGIAALYWFLREVTNRVPFAIAGTLLFTAWTLDLGYWVYMAVGSFGWAVFTVGLVRHGWKISRYLPVSLGIGYLAGEVYGLHHLSARIVGWLPGRTASVMAVFCLVAMASYARYERLGAPSHPNAEPSPTDPPATRSSSRVATKERKGWAMLALVAAALALGSYEQAVMLPACLLGVAVAFWLQGRRPRWAWQAFFWALLPGYLALRYAVLPHDTSGYQEQQLRSGAGVWIDLSDYAFPPLRMISPFFITLSAGIAILFSWQPWSMLLAMIQGFAGFWEARREWRWALTGWALSFLAFLPMAWLKLFEHYHWWPMALRTIFVVGLAMALGKGVVIAWSPQARQAPLRPGPAPGSLPHP